MNEIKDSYSIDDPVLDASVTAIISPDLIKAYLFIKPPENGGAAPTFKSMMAALAEQKITYNVDINKLRELETNPVYNEYILIAEGIAPVNGLDGTTDIKIRTGKTELKPKENEDGTVDYRELDLVENVHKGQVLCVITPPTEGTPGMSVQGVKLMQRRGRPDHSYLGNNTAYNEDGTALISKIDGQVEFNGVKINVTETFTINGNIDSSTGNISVAGNLYVRGMVMPGFTAEAKGNIDINGSVENATIRAEGNLRLNMGATNSKLYCSGNLRSKFLENCSATVKGNVEAGSLVKCDIICGNNIKVSGSIAKIVGGSYTVFNNIEARSIGSESEVETILELGADYTAVERQRTLLSEINELQKQSDKLRPVITLLQELERSGRLTPDKKESLEKANYSYMTVMSNMSKAKQELEEINERLHKKTYGFVRCSDTIFAGVKVIMGQETLSVKESLRNSRIFYYNGTICIGRAY